MTDRSKSKLLEFLVMLASKGLMNRNTVASRKASVNALLRVLSAEETVDVTVLDIDLLAKRFSNLHGTKFTPDSLKVYASRVRSSIQDFKDFCDDPANFKPKIGAPRTAGALRGDNGGSQKKEDGGKIDAGDVVFPVPIKAADKTADRSIEGHGGRSRTDWHRAWNLFSHRRLEHINAREVVS
jgi:hypothetical protein